MNIARFARFLIAVCPLSLALVLTGFQPVQAQTVLNPSFESPGGFSAPSNWSLWIGSGANGDNLECDPTPANAYQGNSLMFVKGINSFGATKGAYQHVASGWTSGNTYRLSVYCKSTDPTKQGLNYAIGFTLGSSSDGSAATYGSNVVHPSTWTQATVQFVYSGSGGVTIFLKGINDGNTERAGFDLVEVTNLSVGPTPTPTNTPVGPTPTRTNTPVGPTFTPTRTPTSGVPTNTPAGIPKWLLTYGRQCGQFHTAGNGPLAEIFATQENGGLTQVGITNLFNSGTAIFGYTNPGSDPFTPGNVRVSFYSPNPAYDFQVYDPGVATDGSVDCYWDSPLPNPGHHYRFEFHFRKVSNNAIVTMYPYNPIFHFDLVNTFNTSTAEPANYNSDSYSLTEWVSWHAQTFVIPANMNRIIEAKAFAIGPPKFRMKFSILQGGIAGPQVGPSAISREVNSNEYDNVMVAWDINAIPVTPGGTYALKLEKCDAAGNVDSGGFNLYASNNNNYTSGSLTNTLYNYPSRDMVGVVVGAFYGAGAPTPTPGAPTATPTKSPTSPGCSNFNNPGFESGLSSWSRVTSSAAFYAAGPEFSYSPHSGIMMFGGTHSYDSGGSIDTIYQTLCVSPGQSYNFTAWAITGQQGGAATNCRVRLKVDLNGGTNFTDITGWQSPTAWTQLTAPFTATGSSVTLGAEINQQSSLPWNHYYVDDFNLAVGSPAATNTPTRTPTAVPPTPTPTTSVSTATPTPTTAISTATPTRTPTSGPSPTPFPTQSSVSRNLWLYY